DLAAGRRNAHRSVRQQVDGAEVEDGADGALEHGGEQLDGPLVDEVHGTGVERIDAHEQGGEAVVVPALLEGVALHAAGRQGVVIDGQEVLLGRLPNLGAQALAQEAGDVVGRPAQPTDLPIDSGDRRLLVEEQV